MAAPRGACGGGGAPFEPGDHRHDGGQRQVCNCGGGTVTPAGTSGQQVRYRHIRPDNTHQDYATPGEAWAAQEVSGGRVVTIRS